MTLAAENHILADYVHRTMTGVVTRQEGVKGGRPILRGTKLTVTHVYSLVHDHDISPEEIVAMYSGVDDVDVVNEALDYYESHPDEMEQLEKERESAVSQLLM